MRAARGLDVESLSFSYLHASPIICDWSATFAPGSMTAITGGSGRGKSTLLYLLGLMLRPDSGEIRLGGVNLALSSDAARARERATHFGFVFQDAALDATISIADNVTEGVLYRGGNRDAALPHAAELLQRFGVDLPINRKPGQVSGGQAQRIALCRALLGRPAVVLADEPTGNLDPESAAIVVEGLKLQASRGAIVVVVTHTRDVANACDAEVQL